MRKTNLLQMMLLLCALIVGSVSAWAAEAVYSTCVFGSSNNSKGVTSYTASWSASNGGFTWNITNANNNNNGWSYVKFGSKNAASTGTIVTSAAYTEAITKVVVTIDAITETDINSVKLYTSTNNTTWTEAGTFTKAKGAQTVTLSSPAANLYYKVEFDCKQASSNGPIQVSKVEYYYNATVAVTGVSLNKSALSLAVGESETLVATVTPDNATNKTVVWSSSNSDIASVDASTGKVTAKAIGGPVTITATTEDGSKTATCAVTVIAARVDVTGVSLNKPSTEITIGDTETLIATVTPNDATNKAVSWESSDKDVATVVDGVVTAVGIGLATITVTTEDGNFTATCAVKVNPVSVTGVELDKTAATITCGDTETLTATVAPSNATNKNVVWESSNEKVATVADGVVTAIAVGTATITVTTEDGSKTATCAVTVEASSAKPALTETVFEETFAKCNNSTGGTDGTFNQASGTKITTADNFTDKSGWTLENGYPAKECLKMGAGSSLGKATTPALALESGITYTLTFRAAPWTGKSTNLKVSMTNGTLSGSSVTMEYDTFKEFELTITDASADAKITFEGNAAKDSQFFLDDVKITKSKSTVDVKLSATGYASYCSPFALDLTPTADYAAYAVTGTSDATVTFSKIPGKVKANTPFILYNTENAGKTVKLPIIDDEKTGISAVSGNMLRGTLSPTYVATTEGDYTNFGLSKGSFVKINDGVIPANKAILPILTENVPAGARMMIVFDEGQTTGINSIENSQLATGSYYNLAGQRVQQPTKGLYIIGGKKVVVK